MPIKVELFLQCTINGRPIWRKAKAMKNEMSFLLGDKEYDKVLDAAIVELGGQIKKVKQEKEKVETK